MKREIDDKLILAWALQKANLQKENKQKKFL